MEQKQLFDYVVKSRNGCWNWTRCKQAGYGVAYFGKRRVLAHRAAWESVNGPIPEGMSICHSCDNPSCINPAHLWLGTHKQNMHDAIQKGRASKPPVHVGGEHWRLKYPHMVQRGEDNPNAIMTDEQVIQMRKDYVSGQPLDEICARYEINRATMHDYTSGRSWKHLLGVDGSPTLEQLKAECARRMRNNASLTREIAEAIRARVKAGETQRALAAEYGVTNSTINDITQRRTWA